MSIRKVCSERQDSRIGGSGGQPWSGATSWRTSWCATPRIVGDWQRGERVIDAIKTNGGWLRGTAVGALLAVSLAACGDQEQPEADQPAVDAAATENAAFDEGASPEALFDPAEVNAPEDIDVIEVAIEDGQLDPNRIEGFIDNQYVLAVTGDGAEHTLEIEGLVTGETIAAEGVTEVEMSISGELGDREITLDGEPAGTFEVQNAAGITGG